MTSATRRALPALLLTTGVLAVAFAGGATAAGLITGEQIKNNSITNQRRLAKLRNLAAMLSACRRA